MEAFGKCIFGLRKRCPVLKYFEEAVQLAKVEQKQASKDEISKMVDRVTSMLAKFFSSPLTLLDVLAKFCSMCPYRMVYIHRLHEELEQGVVRLDK